MAGKIILLIKIFDQEQHADDFINQGAMYCRSLGEFKRYEDDEERGDIYEGVTHWHQPNQIKLVLTHKNDKGIERSFPINDLAGPLIVQNSNFDYLNLFCMYAVKIPDFEENYETEAERIKAVKKINAMLRKNTKLHKKALTLGNYAVVVTRPQDFIDQVHKTAKESGYRSWSGSIKYFEPDSFNGSFEGLQGVFQKRDIYQHHNEYRFAFDCKGPEQTRIINIGSLKDQAFKIPTNKINGIVKVTLKE
jgi:hypothetical protein